VGLLPSFPHMSPFIVSLLRLLSRCVRMSSSAFSFEEFDALLASASSDAVPSARSSGRSSGLTVATSTSSSTGVHGESPVVVVHSVPGDGMGGRAGGGLGGFQGNLSGLISPPSKRVSLILEPSDATLCLGMISTSKFCIKPLLGEAVTCGAAAHGKKFQPARVSAFLKENEVRAFCTPTLDLSMLTPAQYLRIQGVQLSKEEWVQLFEQIQNGTPPKWMTFDDDLKLDDAMAPNVEETESGVMILSPAHAAAGSLLGLIPMLSFDSASSSNTNEEVGDLEEVVASIHTFRAQFASLKTKWFRAFTEVESGYGLLVKDLQKVHQLVLAQASALGAPTTTDTQAMGSVWDGINQMQQSVASVTATVQHQAESLGQLAEDHQTLTQSVIALESAAEDGQVSLSDKVSAISMDVRALENRMLRLIPVLNQLKRGNTVSVSPTSTATAILDDRMNDRLRACEDAISALKHMAANMHHPKPMLSSAGTSMSVLESQFKELSAHVKQLQHKVVGKGVRIGNSTFQSFEDVTDWVNLHLPNYRYGLFVDGVSLFEFFSAGHVDAETTYTSFYSQHRTGFKSTFEARVASSVQNLFPTVFGKSDSNVDTSEALPALPTADRWDSNDGNTGLRHQIMRNMPDVELQIQETINTVLGDYPEARHLARECLHQSKRFAMELCQFITLDFQKWKHRGHAKRDAWKMTAVCVRRIFEELYSERVVARDVYDQSNQAFTTAKYLWATWRAHGVMTNYLKHQFYEHPSISAVLARHLADNYVKPDDTQGAKLKTLEAQLKTFEAAQKVLQSKYDTLRVERDKEKAEKADKDTKVKNWKGPPVTGSG